ncbi:unnamed protein product [Caenorhabditis bovis]|uniref:Protein sidekick homolog n=1 Tax=Caenorhabditis bovis TaxID=2654633 RepID=A0A8S1F859_9PELO|nr:unnamed protein product [Caenorhabditis bovis]
MINRRIFTTASRRRKRIAPFRLFQFILFLSIGVFVDAQLVLGKPPVFTSAASAGIRSVNEGETIIVKCDESPLAESFEWRVDDANGVLVSASRSIELTAARGNDAKQYRCVARNSVATAISSPTIIRSKYLDDFDGSDESIQYEISTGIGRHFVLRRPKLIASEGLDVNYSWFKDDSQQVTSNGTHFVTSEGDLVVTDVRKSDFGEYKLIANSDDLSEIVSKAYIVTDNGMSPPLQNSLSIIYWPSDRTIVESKMPKDVHFDCSTSFGSGDDVRINWFLDEVPISGSEIGVKMTLNNRRLTISNPSGFSKGEHKLECKADASMGRTFDKKATYFTFIEHPVLKDLPSEVRRPIRGSVSLKCGLKRNKGQNNASIKWFKNGVPFATNRGRLVINSIEQEDYGLYQCEGINEAGADIKSVWLAEGNDDASIAFSEDPIKSGEDELPIPQRPRSSEEFPAMLIKSPKDATVASGTARVTLECVASGNPQPRLMWYFNGHEIHTGNSKYDVTSDGLIINDVRKSDEGEYTCEIAGMNSAESKSTAVLNVTGDNLIEYGPTDQKSLIGTNVEFSCEVAKEYARRAVVDWFLNDELLSKNGNSGLRISRNRKGSLIIRHVGPDNTGEYRCVVRVDGREESASAMLQIIEKPAMPERVRAELHNETMPAKVRVLWSEGFDGNEPIIKHAIEMRTLGPTGLWSDWQSVIDNIPKEEGKPCCFADIEDIRPSSTAEFRVIASNKHGPGKASLSSNSVTMPQQPPSAAPRNVAASARSSHSVIVQWQQPKEEQATGDVLGYVVRYRLAGYSSLPWNERNLTTKDARNAVIDNLITWREYEVQVAAYNKRGLGVFSESIEVTTSEGVPTQAPKNVKVKILNSTAVSVDFTAPDQQRIPGVNLGYKVQFWDGEPEKGKLYKEVLLDPDRRQLSTVVTDLEKFGHYNLTVLCFTTPGDGPKSNPVAVITDEDTPDGVDSLSIAEVMYNGAVITWNPPLHENGVITKYTIRHWAASSPDVKTKHEVDGKTLNFTIEGLQPSTRYGVDVMASTKKGDGPVEETKFESGVPPELPGRPSSLSIGDITATTVQLHFTPGFDGHTAIRQWIVEARIVDSSVFTHIFNISAPKARSITVTGLRPYTEYQLRLIAENVKGRGAPSEPSRSFETLQTNPATPSQRLFAEPVSATSIGVSWTPLLATQWNGQPKGYLIVYRENGEEDWKEIRTPALRASEYTITELRPYTDYEVNVFSENAFGRSVPTDAVTARTYESVPSGAPRSLKATVDGPKAVIVKWEPVAELSTNGEVIGYKIRVVPDIDMPDEIKEVDVPGQATLMTKVTNLRPFTKYHVYASAYTIVGYGPENSMPVAFETLEDVPTPPGSFQCSYVSESEVRLKWVPPASPNGKILNYIVSYWKSHEPRTMAIDAPLLGNLLMFSATSLNPNTQYTFAIKTVNSKGESEEALAEVMTSSVRVPIRNPPVPARDQQSQYGATEIVIRWDATSDAMAMKQMMAQDAESPIRSVQVSYQKANDDEWTMVDNKFEYSKHRGVIKRLSPNSKYRFRIRYIGDFLESSWSSESEWMQTMPAPPIAQPIAVKATPYETSSLLLEWTVPHRSTWNSDSVGYHIHYREYPSNDSWSTNEIELRDDHAEKEKIILEKLESFRHYIVRMRMFNSEGEGPFSTPVFVYVGYSIPKKNVTNVRSEPLSSSSIRVKWDAWPKDESEVITSFKVRYIPVLSVLSPVVVEEEVMIVDTNECVLNDLRKFTEYQISISPYNRAGEGKMTQIREKTLEDVPGPVGAIRFTDILLDSVKVSWDPPSQPNGIVTGYIVNYKGFRMQEEFKNEDQMRTTKNVFEATNLAEGVTYFFSVWAETSAGKGESRSSNVTIGPSRDGPPAPSKPIVVPGQSSVTIQWKDLPASDIVGHLIQAKRVSVAEETPNGYVSQRPRIQKRAQAAPANANRPIHPIGEWVTLQPVDGTTEKEQVSYRDLQPSSFYVFRVFARNARGVGMGSAESEQLFVPESIPDDPFYTAWWFMALLVMAAFVLIVVFIAILCVTGSTAKYRREKRARSIDSLQLADGNFASFQLKGTGAAGNITRSRGELPTRPGTTQSWLSDQSREPPAYGSVLGDGPNSQRTNNSAGLMNMYGLATDVMPPLPNAEAMQRLSALVGRDVRGGGSVYVTSSARGSDNGRNEYMATRSDYGNRSEYGRIEYNGRVPSTVTSGSHQQQQRLSDEPYDSFDEEDGVESVDGSTIRGDSRRPSAGQDPSDDIAKHYGSTDQYRDTWRKVRDTEAVRGPILSHLPGSAAGRSSTTESTSEGGSNWPHTPNPLNTGFSSFV